MDKKYRKELEQRLSLLIVEFLKKSNGKATEEISKVIKSASKDIAKKFVKKSESLKAASASQKPLTKPAGVALPSDKKPGKLQVKKAVKKLAGKAVKKVAGKSAKK